MVLSTHRIYHHRLHHRRLAFFLSMNIFTVWSIICKLLFLGMNSMVQCVNMNSIRHAIYNIIIMMSNRWIVLVNQPLHRIKNMQLQSLLYTHGSTADIDKPSLIFSLGFQSISHMMLS